MPPFPLLRNALSSYISTDRSPMRYYIYLWCIKTNGSLFLQSTCRTHLGQTNGSMSLRLQSSCSTHLDIGKTNGSLCLQSTCRTHLGQTNGHLCLRLQSSCSTHLDIGKSNGNHHIMLFRFLV